MPAKVLIPVDAFRNSKTAEEYAVKLNEKMPLTAVLLHVIDTKELDGHGLDPGLKESIISAKRKNAEKIVAEAADGFKAAGIEIERIITSGDPSHLICYTAQNEGVDMVLMAESGRSEFQDWFVGSVTNYVLYRCTSPVLLVKHPRG
jgi:nucleotide-binding universal stress UspA family protein